MLLIPRGLTGASKTPGARSEVLYSQGGGSTGNTQRYLLVAGHKLSTSTLADYEIRDVTEAATAISEVGEGSELSGMIRFAMMVPGIQLKYLAVPEPSGGTQATATLTFSGTTAATAGTLTVYLDEHVIQVPIGKGDSPTVAGDSTVTWVGAEYDVFCTAANSSGVVTFTVRNKGARGSDHVLYVDKSLLPTGLSVAIAGGTAHSNTAVPFTGGAGSDTIASVLAPTVSIKLDYTAWAMNDTTSLSSVNGIPAQAVAKSGTFGAGPENFIVGFSGTSANAITRAKAINQQLGQLVWMEGIVHPSKLAAAMGAMRSVVEASPVTELGNPNANHDEAQLMGIPAHRRVQDYPTVTVTDNCLNGGTTPVITKNGTARVCRSITTYCLNGSVPDYRTLDTGAAVTPQRIREAYDSWWVNEHRPSNPFAGPDAPDGDLPQVQGRSTPKLVLAYTNPWLEGLKAQNLLDSTNDPATAEFNESLDCVVVNIPAKVARQNHISATVIRQIGT